MSSLKSYKKVKVFRVLTLTSGASFIAFMAAGKHTPSFLAIGSEVLFSVFWRISRRNQYRLIDLAISERNSSLR
jgi:hypothetical protein